MTEKRTIIDRDLIQQIEGFLRSKPMKPTAFGRAVANDSMLLRDLKRGRDMRRSTRERILSFIAKQSQPLSDSPPKQGRAQ